MKRNDLINILIKGKNSKLVSNFASLSLIQAANLLLPLITFPYLVRVLGVEQYGLVFFSQAFITYFTILADYGFNLSGAREISLNRNDLERVTTIYNSILVARLGLVLVGFFLMLLAVFSISKFRNDWVLYIVTYGMVLGNSLFPTWFFQGFEKMKYITILTLISKILFTIAIFLVIKRPDDYLMVPLLHSSGYIFSGLIALYIINKKFHVKFIKPDFLSIKKQMRKGWYIFISKISTSLYTATTTIVLGLITNNTMVGYFAISDKVVRIILMIFSPLTQTIYPHLVNLVQGSEKEAITFFQRTIKFTLYFTFPIWVIGFLTADFFFELVFGNDVKHSIMLFKMLSPLLIVLPLASVFFNNALLAFNLDKFYFKIYRSGAILNFLLLAVLLFYFDLGTVGAAISLLICETFLTCYAAFILYNNKVLNFKLPKFSIQKI